VLLSDGVQQRPARTAAAQLEEATVETVPDQLEVDRLETTLAEKLEANNAAETELESLFHASFCAF